ncbi:MAG: cysteine--tRNA ligase [bacterium]|nr:cysteine--tRNA ligase [bacterium]
MEKNIKYPAGPLKIYNTLSRKKEEFVPLLEGRIGMYVCGVTVYDDCHLGHGRSAVAFDVIRRYLEKLGYKVTFVKNFTDVDDKIINRANKDGIKSEKLTEKYIEAYSRDMAALGVKKADIEPKATEHIKEMVELISDLVKKGYAYESNGDVYFSVRKFKGYGKLSGRSLDELEAGARVEVNEQKKDPLDFALWKKSKPDEPWWDSPWGKGRPGWHIECSAMSKKYLGNTLDIHAGGQDLVFPHHENEVAQSEASTGEQFSRYWMHNGFVNINKEKMSKSLGNFFTISDILKKYDGEVVRFFLLSTHYRSPIDYSDKELDSAGNSVKRIYNTLANIDDLLNRGLQKEKRDDTDEEFLSKIKKSEEKFKEGMNDDFNTSEGVAAIFELVRDANIYMEKDPAKDILLSAKNKIRELGNILGLFQKEIKESIEDVVEQKIKERENARKNKDFAASDRIRDELKNMGIILEDKKDGTRWKKE